LAGGVRDSAAALGGLTRAGACSGEKSADRALAFGVLVAADIRCALVSSYAWNKNALLLGVTFVVELSTTATKDDVTLIGTGAGDDKTSGSGGRAFGVFGGTGHKRRTLVGTGGRGSNTLTLRIAHRLLWAAADEGITFVRSLYRESDAGGEIRSAFGVLGASVYGRAFIGATTGNFDALILSITDHVSDGSAVIDEGIAEVCSCTGDSNASGEIRGALVVGKALRIGRAFAFTDSGNRGTDFSRANRVANAIVVRNTRVISFSSNNDALQTSASEMTAIRNTLKGALAFIFAFTGSSYAFILQTNKVLADIALVLIRRIAQIISSSGSNITHTFSAFEVFVGFDAIGFGVAVITAIIVRPIDGDTGVAGTNVMFGTIVIRDAGIGSISLDNDTLTAGVAFEVFIGIETFLPTEAFIRAFSGEGETDVLCVAGEVFSGVTFFALLTLILPCSGDDSAEVENTGHVLIGLNTITIDGALIGARAIHGDAGVALAYGMR
jgi:hypothetical protein